MRVKKHMVHQFLKISFVWGAFLTVGCSNENWEEKTPVNEVVFDTKLPEDWNPMAKARAGVVGNTELQSSGFGVYAYYTKDKPWASTNATVPNFMNNTQVCSADNGTSWTYRPVKYWPTNQGDKISFFAYAPYVSSLTATGSKLNYAVPTDVEEQVDLMWSHSNTTDLQRQEVKFIFQHALSRIGFTVEAEIGDKSPIDEYEKVIMKIKKVVLTSVSDYSGTGTGPFYKRADLDMNNQKDVPSWTYIADSETQSYTLTESELAGRELTLNKDNTTVEPKRLTDDDNYLMIIPQDFSVDGFNVYVEYDVDLYFTGNGTSSEYQYFTYTNGCAGNLKLNLEPAKSYIINIQLGLKDATLGEVSITDWKEKEIDLPQLVN